LHQHVTTTSDRLLANETLFAGIDTSGTHLFDGARFSPTHELPADDITNTSTNNNMLTDDDFAIAEEYDPLRPSYNSNAAMPPPPPRAPRARHAVPGYDPENPSCDAAPPAQPPPAFGFGAMYANMLMTHQSLVADELSFMHQ
jgi:hypothetical protein